MKLSKEELIEIKIGLLRREEDLDRLVKRYRLKCMKSTTERLEKELDMARKVREKIDKKIDSMNNE